MPEQLKSVTERLESLKKRGKYKDFYLIFNNNNNNNNNKFFNVKERNSLKKLKNVF